MVVQYPYSLSLRYLLAMKSQKEDNTDLDRNIELLATYSIDRTHLHRIFSEGPIVLEDLEESIIMGEDFLELKELSSLERDLEEKLVINEVNDLNFLQEKTALEKEISIPSTAQDLPPPPPDVESLDESMEIKPDLPLLEEVESATPSTSISDAAIINMEASANEEEIPTTQKNPVIDEEESLVEETKEAEPLAPETLVEQPLEEEKFVTLDFEDNLVEEISGKAVAGNELAPSAAFASNEIIEESGLPEDAVEINDLYIGEHQPTVDDALVEALITASEGEPLAEPAVSDSIAFIENPEEVLVEESELISTDDVTTEEPETEKVPATISSSISVEEEKTTDVPSIPFEVEFSASDPVTIESIQEGTAIIFPEETNKIAEESLPTPLVEEPATSASISENLEVANIEEVETITPVESLNEAIVNPTIQEEVGIKKSTETVQKENTPSPAKATFKFDSLDRLEATLNQPINIIKPAPKTKFHSWQEQYAGVRQFSGVNLVSLKNGKGKTIKKKRKVVRKQFEETVAYAEESLELDTALVSETLAQLLVKQGQYSKARSMYEKLCLIIPEKSGFFANEIEKIQNLPDEDS